MKTQFMFPAFILLHILRTKQRWQAFLLHFATPEWQCFQFCPLYLGSLHSKLGYCWLSISNVSFLRISVSQPENVTQNKTEHLWHHKCTELLTSKMKGFFFFFHLFFHPLKYLFTSFFSPSLYFGLLKIIELLNVTSLTLGTKSL